MEVVGISRDKNLPSLVVPNTLFIRILGLRMLPMMEGGFLGNPMAGKSI